MLNINEITLSNNRNLTVVVDSDGGYSRIFDTDTFDSAVGDMDEETFWFEHSMEIPSDADLTAEEKEEALDLI